MNKLFTISALSAMLLIGSIGNAEAGRRGHGHGAAIGLGIMGAIIGGAIIADQYHRHNRQYHTHPPRRYRCYYERERYWSNRYHGWYWRTVERCY